MRVRKKIPPEDAYKVYRDSLEVRSVRPFGGGIRTTLVRVDPDARRVTRVDASHTVLYVRPKRVPNIPPYVSVLARYSPWTADTLPLAPKPTEADIVSRRVRVSEVERVRLMRLRGKQSWLRDLARGGVRPSQAEQRLVPRALGAYPDIMFEALRLEFGIGKAPSPHWRPAIAQVPKLLRKILQDKDLQATLKDTKFAGWRRGLRTHREVDAGVLSDMRAFGRAVGR